MKILVIDDDPQLRESLHLLLTYFGHEVSVAAEPAAALAALERSDQDLLLLDWLLPGGGVEQVLAAIRTGKGAAKRVVLMTGLADSALPPSARSYPVLYKPFGIQDLTKLVDQVKPLHVNPSSPL